jgi:hypothetical protein
MVKASKQGITHGWSGSIGSIVFRQMSDGSTRVSVKPDFSERKFSQAQIDHQNKVRVAAAYAHAAAKNEPLYTELTRGTTRNAYNLAFADCLKPPVIHALERTGGRVRVTASDNVMVTRVRISILDHDGRTLEQGDAAQPDPLHDPDRWEYAWDAGGTVTVTAWDLAGNQTSSVLSPSSLR